jgi:hypothetical protein
VRVIRNKNFKNYGENFLNDATNIAFDTQQASAITVSIKAESGKENRQTPHPALLSVSMSSPAFEPPGTEDTSELGRILALVIPTSPGFSSLELTIPTHSST